MIKELNEFIKEAESYKAWNGKTCYRQFGGLDYYHLLCNRFGLNPRPINAVHYLAKNEYIGLEYIEHDIILSIDRVKDTDEWGHELTYTIVNKIPKGFTIWNIGEHAPENILPLVICDEKYSINTNHMLAIITPNAQTILSAVGICGDTAKDFEKYISKHDNIFADRMKKALPLLKEIDNRQTTKKYSANKKR